MTDDTARIERPDDEHAPLSHFCEYPGCARWGGLGYDVGQGQLQWFCHEHKWTDYKMGKPPRMYFDDEAAGIDAIMTEPRAASFG